MLFETWPRRADHPLYRQSDAPRDPAHMARLTHTHYTHQAGVLDAVVAPVAPAWMQATAEGIDLYAADGYHANLHGAWLCAMLLADALGMPKPFEAMPPKAVPPGIHAALAKIAAQTTP